MEKINNKIDTVTFNVPTITRLFEYFMESEEITDVELHFMLERIINISKTKDILTMEDYNNIIEK